MCPGFHRSSEEGQGEIQEIAYFHSGPHWGNIYLGREEQRQGDECVLEESPEGHFGLGHEE